MLSKEFADQIKAVKQAASIAEVIGEYVTLRRTGRNLTGLCPFPDHTERTPSFNVNEERQIFKCFGCGRGGDVFKFLQEIAGFGFVEAVEVVARRFGAPFERGREHSPDEEEKRARFVELLRQASDHFRTALGAGAEGKRALDYLKKRGVGDALIEKFALGYSPTEDEEMARKLKRAGFAYEEMAAAGLLASGGRLSRFHGRVIFPIVDRFSRTVGFGGRALESKAVEREVAKYINSAENPLFHKSKILYGLNLAQRKITAVRRVIVVEGYMDLIAMHAAGFEETVAPLGTALTAQHVASLVKAADRFLLFFDSDRAGFDAALKAGLEFAGFDHEPHVVTLGVAAKDPDEFLKRYGVRLLEERLEKAVPFIDFLLGTLAGKLDLATMAGRGKAAREFIAPLLRTGSPIKRGEYARKAADFLKITVGELTAITRSVEETRPAGSGKPAVEPRRRSAELSPLHRELFQALIANPKRVAEFEAARVSGEVDLPDADLAGLLARLGDLAATGDRGAFELSVRDHPYAEALVAILLEETADPDRLFEGCINRLRREKIGRDLVALEREIKTLEKSGDIGKIGALQKQYMELVRRMAGLK